MVAQKRSGISYFSDLHNLMYAKLNFHFTAINAINQSKSHHTKLILGEKIYSKESTSKSGTGRERSVQRNERR